MYPRNWVCARNGMEWNALARFAWLYRLCGMRAAWLGQTHVCCSVVQLVDCRWATDNLHLAIILSHSIPFLCFRSLLWISQTFVGLDLVGSTNPPTDVTPTLVCKWLGSGPCSLPACRFGRVRIYALYASIHPRCSGSGHDDLSLLHPSYLVRSVPITNCKYSTISVWMAVSLLLHCCCLIAPTSAHPYHCHVPNGLRHICTFSTFHNIGMRIFPRPSSRRSTTHPHLSGHYPIT